MKEIIWMELSFLYPLTQYKSDSVPHTVSRCNVKREKINWNWNATSYLFDGPSRPSGIIKG